MHEIDRAEPQAEPPGESIAILSAEDLKDTGRQEERGEAGWVRVSDARRKGEPKLWAAFRDRGMA